MLSRRRGARRRPNKRRNPKRGPAAVLQRTQQQPPPRRQQQLLRLMQARAARRVPRKTRRRIQRARRPRRPRRMQLLGRIHHRWGRPQRTNPAQVRTELPPVRQQCPRQALRKLHLPNRPKLHRRRRRLRNRGPLRPRSYLHKLHHRLLPRLNLPRVLLVRPVENKQPLLRGMPQMEPLRRSRSRSQRVLRPRKQRNRATQAKRLSRSSSLLQQYRKLVPRRPSHRRGHRSQATALPLRNIQTVETTIRR